MKKVILLSTGDSDSAVIFLI